MLVYLNTGQTLQERGASEEALYVISAGEIVAQGPIEGTAGELRAFGSGQIIGEGALFEHRPWPATYKVKTKATLLKLTAPGLQICLTGNPDPRGFLDVLRREQNDREVTTLVARMEASA
jgi:CRP-like cAMP-binding protein